MNVQAYRPKATVVFHTENGDLVARATNNPKSAMDDDILSIVTTRDMQADSPTFTLQLSRRKPWDQWVASNDLVVISMQRPPEVMSEVFFGLVDDCRKKVTVSDNSVQRVITVTGREFAKALIRFDVGVVPEAEYSSTAVGWLEASGVVLAGSTPATICKAIWDTIAKKHVAYKWDNGETLFKYAQTDFSDRDNIQLLDSSTIMNYQGSLQALFKDVAEDPFYEVFWEVKKSKPTFTVRPTPFNPDKWKKLPMYYITDEDVISDDTGRSDVETYTIFSVGAQTLFSPYDTYKTFGVLPYWYKPYADKYGNSRLHVESAYTSVASGGDAQTQTATMRSLMVDLYNWNILNNSMMNGTIYVKGSNRFKIGTRLNYASTETGVTYEYYITSVGHQFVNFGNWITILGVTRGMEPKKRFEAPWGKYTEYSGMGIIPFDPKASRDAMQLDSNPNPPGAVDFMASNKVVAGAKDVMNNGINGLKVRYVFGGNNPEQGLLDCSSFTQYIYEQYAQVSLGRTTGQQVTKGSKVDKDKAMPGDLIFFCNTYASNYIYGVSHVGIYIGNNQFINNEPNKGVVVASLDTSYWKAHFLMFRRVLSADQLSSGGASGGGAVSGGTTFTATAYGATALNVGGGAGFVPTFKTATGTTPKEGRTIAVDPRVIPLYSQVQISCDSYPSINGTYTAEDTGGAIKGNRIDIFFNDLPPADPVAAQKRMYGFGTRKIQVKITRRGKGG